MAIALTNTKQPIHRFSILLAIIAIAICITLHPSVVLGATYTTSATPIHLEKPDDAIVRPSVMGGIRSSVVYHANWKNGFYNHHPHIAQHGSNFYVAWSNHPVDEDERGQRVLLSRSPNGHNWSLPVVLFPALKAATGQGLVFTANGWVVLDGALYAIADLHDNIGWTDNEGIVISQQQSSRNYRTAQRSIGRLARRVNDDSTMSAPFWLARMGGTEAVCPNCQRQTQLATTLNAVLQEPLNRRHWQLMDGNRMGYWIDRYPIKGQDGHHLVEPTTYRARDGLLVRLLRDLDVSYRLYATTSLDGGKNWSQPTRTNLPDSPSLTCAGALIDGRRYLIGNPVPGSRDPLAIRFSQDGIGFGPAQILRRDASPMRRQGLNKGPGFQYPSAVATGDTLWLTYSVNKEDIEVSRVELSHNRKVRR